MNNASLELGGTNWAEKDASLLGYTVSDDSGRFFPQEFTFSRGSNLAATRIGKTGLIEKGRENLLLQSNQFNTSPWSLYNGTLTSGQSGYDGSSDAWVLDKSGSDGRIFQNVSFSGVTTFSIYAKPNTNSWMRLYFDTIGVSAFFDLANGVKGSFYGAGLIDLKIESVGTDGWYRCSVLMNGSGSSCRVYTAEANSTSATSGSIYIQDAQLELGLAASPYIPTTTTTAQAGVLENTPRLNYTTGVANPYLLLEPQRTNTYRSSEWIPNLDADLSQEVSDINSPIKNTPFLKITKNTSGLSRQTLYTSTNGDIDTCSVFAKKGSTGGNQIYFADSHYGSSTMNASFDLDTGDWFVTPSGTALVDYGFEDFGNGMYRIWVAGRTMDSANIDPTRWRSPALFLDNGQLSVGEYIYITGLQTERNASYPTSYIPTYRVSATRGQDACIKTSYPDLSSQQELTLYAEFNYEKSGRVIAIGNGTTSTRFFASYGSDKQMYMYLNIGGTLAFFLTSSNNVLSDGKNKVAVKIKSGESLLYLNGAEIFNNTSTFTLSGFQNVYIGTSEYGSTNDTQKIDSSLIFYNALSAAELATLTTI